MLTARGYDADASLAPVTWDDYRHAFETYSIQERIVIVPRSKPSVGNARLVLNAKAIVLFFAIIDSTLGVKTLRPIQHYMRQHDYSRAILIVDRGITPEVRSEVLSGRRQAAPNKLWMEVFRINELTFPKVEHVLQPRSVRLLDLDERTEVLERYSFKGTQLLSILLRDPLVRYCGALPHDVLRIEQKSQTGGSVIRYRFVIHNPRSEKLKAIFNTML